MEYVFPRCVEIALILNVQHDVIEDIFLSLYLLTGFLIDKLDLVRDAALKHFLEGVPRCQYITSLEEWVIDDSIAWVTVTRSRSPIIFHVIIL